MKVISYQLLTDRKTLNAYFAVSVPEWDLIVEHMCEFVKGSTRWVGMPSFREERQGKLIYIPYLRFGVGTEDKFLRAAKEALDKYLAGQ